MLSRRLCAGLAVAGLAAIGVAAAPTPAEAWWRGGWCCGFGATGIRAASTPGLLPAAARLLCAASGLLPAAAGVDTRALAGDNMGTWPLGVRRGW
jgi:hypothetical protein